MDVLFNNAGIGESGYFEDIPYEARYAWCR